MQRIWMKLAVILMLVSGGGILLSTILSVKEMNYHFSMYVEDMNSMYSQRIIEKLKEAYRKDQGFGPQTNQMLKDVADVLGLKVNLYHPGQVPPDLPDSPYPVVIDHQPVGFINIERDGDVSDHSLEDHFQIAHTSALLWTMIILTILVCGVSILVARRLVKPIIEMSRAARLASEGNLSVQVSRLKSEDELSDLVISFNQLVVALQAQEELRKRLTSDIAHELRTPLNTILAQVEGMIDGIWSATPEHLESTRVEVLRLSRLVNDLDLIMKAETGEHNLTVSKFRVHEVLQEVAASMSATFQRAEVALQMQCDQEMWMEGDRQRLAQILVNLLSNSLKHTLSQGQVRIMAKPEGNRIVLQVTDTGSGIAAHDLPFVFERFYRGDRSRQRETGGSGLGLTIVKGLVEAHHGTIEIESEPGKGTTVTITFPQTFHQG